MDEYLKKEILNIEKKRLVVSKIRLKNKEYVLKKNLDIYSYADVSNKKRALDILFDNGINVARICDIFRTKTGIYELQEYIAGHRYDGKFIFKLYQAIGKMHSLSLTKEIFCSTKSFYNFNFECRNIKLKKLLIDFKYKFYYEPRKNICRLIDKTIYSLELREIIKIYDDIYKKEEKKISSSNTVLCHNDLSEGNIIINDGKIFFIDFDFYRYNYLYCDLVDVFLPRELELDTFLEEFPKYKKRINKIIKIYSSYVPIDYESFLDVLKLKLVSSYFYFLIFTEDEVKRKENIYNMLTILNIDKI